jgi:hypothetical protein
MTGISLEDALTMLPTGNSIHTFRQGAMNMFIGCDWNRDKLIEAMSKAEVIRMSGDIAQRMNHGMAIHNDGTWLFIQTKKAGK